MTAPLKQIRIHGEAEPNTIRKLSVLESLDEIHIEFRDLDGQRIARVPARIVDIDVGSGDLVYELDVTAVVLRNEPEAAPIHLATRSMRELFDEAKHVNGHDTRAQQAPRRKRRQDVLEREAVARDLAGDGFSTAEIALRMGKSDRWVRKVIRGR